MSSSLSQYTVTQGYSSIDFRIFYIRIRRFRIVLETMFEDIYLQNFNIIRKFDVLFQTHSKDTKLVNTRNCLKTVNSVYFIITIQKDNPDYIMSLNNL